MEKINALGLKTSRPDVASFVGWFLMAVLLVGLLLGWLWRFRPTLWHRDNVLVLTGLLLVGATLALKVTAGRSILPFFLPTAAIGHARSPSCSTPRSRRSSSASSPSSPAPSTAARSRSTTYVFLGGMAGIVDDPQGRPAAGLRPGRVRGLRGQRAGRDGVLAARRARPPGDRPAVVRLGGVGARLGRRGRRHVRGPRLGVRDPHGLPAARAGEPVPAAAPPPAGRDARDLPPLADGREPRGARGRGDRRRPAGHPRRGVLPRHRQAREPAGVHREPGRRRERPRHSSTPRSAPQILKQHVADGIDLAYKSKLPKALIAYIPQHHGTAIMGYFYARARERAAEPFGGLVDRRGPPGRRRRRPAAVPPQRAEAAVARGRDHHARRQRRGVRALARRRATSRRSGRWSRGSSRSASPTASSTSAT